MYITPIIMKTKNTLQINVFVQGALFEHVFSPKGWPENIPKWMVVSITVENSIGKYRTHKNSHTQIPGLACTYFFTFFSAGFQNMDLDTKLTVKNAMDAKTPANSASRRSESNGRRPGPRFGQNSGKKSLTFIWPTRAILGLMIV